MITFCFARRKSHKFSTIKSILCTLTIDSVPSIIKGRKLFREVFSLRYAVGIDMGGTNIAAGIVDTDGQIVGRGSVRTQQSGSPEALCAQLAQAAQLALKNAECDSEAVCGIGVGCPAPVDPEAGRLRFCTNLPQLSAYPICEMLQSLTGLPVYLGNDADAAAWGGVQSRCLTRLSKFPDNHAGDRRRKRRTAGRSAFSRQRRRGRRVGAYGY